MKPIKFFLCALLVMFFISCDIFEDEKRKTDLEILEEMYLIPGFNSPLGISSDSLGNIYALVFLGEKNSLDTIPPEFGKLTNLVYLEIYKTNGKYPLSIPKEFGNLINLRFLSISSVSKFPETFGNLEKLETLNIYNFMGDSLPESIGKLTELSSLTIANSNALKTLPNSISNFKKLKTLHFYGVCDLTLPEEVGGLENLEIFKFENGKLLPPIPDGIRKWSKLQIFELDNYLGNFDTLFVFPKGEYLWGKNSEKGMDDIHLVMMHLPDLPHDWANINIESGFGFSFRMDYMKLDTVSVALAPLFKRLRIDMLPGKAYFSSCIIPPFMNNSGNYDCAKLPPFFKCYVSIFPRITCEYIDCY